MRKSRSFETEYARRIERALARGLTRSAARGHPRAGDTAARAAKSNPNLELALKAMRRGGTLTEAAKTFKISRERLSAYAKSQAGAERAGRTWIFNDRRRRDIAFISEGEVIKLTVEGYEPARLAGVYWDQAHRVLGDHSLAADFVRRWENVTIRAANGRRYTFTTDLNEIYRAAHADDAPFDLIYRLVSP